MSGNLSRRIAVSPRGDEFDELAQQLNAMLERIQQLIRGIRQVTDNIAHDLRSPLTRLRNRLEVTLLETRSSAEYQDEIQQAIVDAESLIGTFNALLSIAQVEAGNHRTEWLPISLPDLAADLVDLYGPVAEEKGLRFDCDIQACPPLMASRELLGPAIGNLLENAIKYTPQGGVIRFELLARGNEILVSVADTGPGIPAQEREHVLKRFVRLDEARNTQGNGLGLSLVKAVADLHRAELTLENANPGLRVVLRFASGKHAARQ